eukprot:6163505-Karenia_brevis.AAC.1
MKEILQERADLRFHGSTMPRPVVEPPPWKRPFLSHGGKALGILEEFKISEVDPQGPPAFEAYKTHSTTGRPLLLLRWTTGGGYKIEEGNIKIFNPELDAAQLHRRLAA